MGRSCKNTVRSMPHPSLDGWWVARTASLGGVRLPPEALAGLAMRLFDTTLYLGSDVGTIDIDRDSDPATIDILITRGPNRWRFIPGIVERQPAQLRLCLDLGGADRPSAFESVPGSRVLLATYHRAPLPYAA